MSVPTNNPQLSGYPGAHNPQGASPYQGATPYQGSAQQGAAPYQGATPYQGSAQQGAAPYPGGVPQSYPGGAPQPYGGAQTQASTKKIPTAFILGIAVWVAIGVTVLMIWNSADESASARDGIAVIPMFGFLVVVPPLTLFGLITGASANKRLMTRKQLIMNRIGIGLSVAPFVVFFLFYAVGMIAMIVERGH